MNTNLTNLAKQFNTMKAVLKNAKAEVDRLQSEILTTMGEESKVAVDGYNITATRGKTRKVLSAELIEQTFGIKITEACYAESKPWDEVRVTEVK